MQHKHIYMTNKQKDNAKSFISHTYVTKEILYKVFCVLSMTLQHNTLYVMYVSYVYL